MSDYALAQQRWQTPDPTFSPAPIWWWSGDRLEPARLRWQLERFAEGGVYNLVILNLAPTGPLHGSRADDPAFLTREWWAIFRGVCQDALELGIKLWFYDQIGFSGANLQGQIVRATPSFVGQQIQSHVQECDRPSRCLFPDGATPLGAWQIDDTGVATALVVQDGCAYSTGVTPHRVRLVYAVTKGFDYLSVAACAALRATVHEAFEREVGDYFGSVIVGSFQDELPSMPTWSADFAQSFVAHYGYDLLAYLPALFEGDDAHSQQVRIDYQRWRAKRSEESFFKPFYAWHEQHALICGFDQQSPARMALPIGAVDEYADYMQTHRWYGAPGSDHHGNGKIHSSMAHLYQRPRSWIEAFHSSGWGGTLEETFDWLVPWLRAGLTLYDPHAVYYSTRGGWWEWAPPSTCWRQPYWRHYRHFAETVMRITGVMALGRHQCDIAVMFPTTTVQAHLTVHGPHAVATRAEQMFVEITGSMFWNNPQPGLLERARRDFDMLDDDSLERAQVDAGVLQIADERYRCLILPALTHLTPQGVAQVNAFVQAGGLVLAVGTLPAGVQVHARVIVVEAVDELVPYLDQLPRRVDGDVLVLERVVDQTPLWLVTPTVSGSQFAWNGHWNSTPYDFDADRLPRHVDIKINVPGVPRQWRMSDGSIVALPQNPDGTWRVDLTDAPIAVVALDGDAPLAVSTQLHQHEQIDLAGEWQIEVVPTLDNRWGDMDLPASAEPMLPHTMRFTTPDGTPYVQGFETYGWFIGPQAVTELPAPLTQLTDDTGLDVTGWSPLVYSLTRGIANDTLHWGMLGPKGYVPEEFMHFGTVEAGQAVRIRTTVVIDQAFAGALVLAAAAAKRIWIDGVCYDDAPVGYQWFVPVQLAAGRHLLEFELAPEQTLNLRGYWALVTHPERFVRPNWIMQADVPQAATYLTFTKSFVLAEASSHAAVMVVADVPIRVMLNGVEIGRQGGFDPYGSTVRVQPYHLKGLVAGTHQLAVEALDGGRGVSILVDGVWYDGQRVIGTVMTGQGWQVTRQGGASVLATVRRRQWVDLTFDTDHALYVDMDPGWPLMWRRQHPLPGAHWLEDAPADGSVLPVVPDAYPTTPHVLDVSWRIPATATRMYLPGHGGGHVTIDGTPCAIEDGVVQVPSGGAIARWQMPVPSGRVGMDVPVRYDHGVGTTALPADAAMIGYADFSGALRFRTKITLTEIRGAWTLDVGRVRGTVAVFVNGVQAGVRIWAPYVVDVSPYLQVGVNQIEIELTNTLASYLAAHSPSHYTPAYQQASGVYGPVLLRRTNSSLIDILHSSKKWYTLTLQAWCIPQCNMKGRTMRALMMLLVMMALLVACGSADSNATNQDPAAEAPVADTIENTTDDVTVEPTDDAAATSEDGASEESIWQADVNRNLDAVKSYVATFSYSSTPEGGEVQEWSWRQVVNRDPFASDTTTSNVAGEGMGEFRMVVIGDQSYLITEGSQCLAITDQDNQNEMMDPQSFMSSSAYDMRKDGSGPTISGRATDKYVGVYNDGTNEVTSTAFVDPSTEITMRWEVSGTSNDNGTKEAFTWVYELSDIDAAPTVAMPAECQAMTEASAYPMPDDAQVTMQSAEMFVYTTGQALADVAAFYANEMPAAGYTEAEGSMTTPDMSMLSYTKDGKTVSVMITVQDGTTNVIITAQ